MGARILAGAPAAQAILAQASQRAVKLPDRPHLVLVRAGTDPASLSYVRGKQRHADIAGLRSTVHALPESVTLPELLALIATLNADRDVHGILIQLPLPAHLPVALLQEAVDPRKDVDGFHPLNVGRLWTGGGGSDHPLLAPCTPLGVLALLRHYEIPVAGRRAVVVGRSDIVGRPMAAVLLGADATVTVAHRQTSDLGAVTREADVLVVAAGQPWLMTPDMVRPGAAVVDVGIHRIPGDGHQLHLTGDVHPEVANVAGALTPVPGGVGPLTVAQLMLNTVIAAERQIDWRAV
ncbi:bifunctional methylenetetrahydrofolate dehydrogenase/methenyltetrahydrofolate cyclohydrolase [Deinococcus deserti]|uniref:Bifunctional protein FolD n=1 Tax=Deinococcus deserti (strain DSM 17065 / CIP 109153 / LMG 22923 / VCD115) TaxID=546414 RepID=C1CVC4_DEIDV|nr:bifunctional methylenetetrahydrofolate dehydrogenase/methenyltetrahydrofolate cyclohydrolase [Deinococcus deserti]ACO46141.1 putative bifunctional protein folD [Deinococcus deserti VCD115]